MYTYLSEGIRLDTAHGVENGKIDLLGFVRLGRVEDGREAPWVNDVHV